MNSSRAPCATGKSLRNGVSKYGILKADSGNGRLVPASPTAPIGVTQTFSPDAFSTVKPVRNISPIGLTKLKPTRRLHATKGSVTTAATT